MARVLPLPLSGHHTATYPPEPDCLTGWSGGDKHFSQYCSTVFLCNSEKIKMTDSYLLPESLLLRRKEAKKEFLEKFRWTPKHIHGGPEKFIILLLQNFLYRHTLQDIVNESVIVSPPNTVCVTALPCKTLITKVYCYTEIQMALSLLVIF